MSVEGGVGERLALVLAEELRIAEPDVIDLVARALAVHLLPLFARAGTFAAARRVQ